MPKYVSAKTGKVTYVGKQEKTPTGAKYVSATTGKVTYATPIQSTPSAPKTFTFKTEGAKDYWGTKAPTSPPTIKTKPEVKSAYKSVSATVPIKTPYGGLKVDVPRETFEKAKALPVKPKTKEFKRVDVKGFDKPKSTYQPSNIWQVTDIGQLPGLGIRSVQSAGEMVFPIVKGSKYSSEELKSWKKDESYKEFEARKGLERGFWTGVTLVTAAIPVGAAVHAGKGVTGAFAGIGAKSIYATKGIGTLAVGKGVTIATTTIGGKLLTGIGAGIVGSQIATPIVKGAIEIVEPSKLDRAEQISISQEARKRTEVRLQEEGLDIPFIGEDIEKHGVSKFLGGIAYELPGGTLGVQTTYFEETKKVLKERGYSEKEAHKIAQTESKREVIGGSFGELGGLVLSAGVVGELVGRGVGYKVGTKLGAGTKLLTKGQAQVASTITGASAGLAGGLVESAIMYPAKQQARYREIKAEEWAFETAIGGATAGILGGAIGFLSARSPGLGSAFYKFLGLAEGGQEFVGDIGAERIIGSSLDVTFLTKGGKQATKTGVVSVVPTLTKAMAVTPTKAKAKTEIPLTEKRGYTKEFSPQEMFAKESLITPTKTPTPTKTKAVTKTESIIKTLIETPTKTKTELPTIVTTPTRTSIYTEAYVGTPVTSPTKTLTETPAVTPTETPTETPTPTATPAITATPTYTFTPTPTMTPTFTGDFLPFIPPIIGGGAGAGKKGTRRERTRFIDEFTLAFAGLVDLTKPVSFGKKGKSITKTRRKYTPKKPRIRATKFNVKKIKRYLV